MKSSPVFAARFHGGVNLLVGDRIHVAEAEVFEFAANLAHAEAVRDGSVDVERLAGDLLLALGREVLQRAHVVQAVGQLDEDDADVVDHGQHHLAQVFGLGFFAGGEVDLADLGDAFDDVRHLLTEFLPDFYGGDRGVFDRVVQQAGGDRNRVHLHVREHVRDFQRMNQVGFARSPRLPGMMFLGELVGLLDQVEVVVGPVLAELLHQLAEAGHREHVGRDLLTQRRHEGF